jgi:hypothetical protein
VQRVQPYSGKVVDLGLEALQATFISPPIQPPDYGVFQFSRYAYSTHGHDDKGAFMVEIATNCETLRMPRDLSGRDPMKAAQYVCAWPTRDHSMFQLQCEYGYRVVFVGPVLVDRPSGTARVYRSIPGTSYRATFIESLPPSPFGLRRTGRDRSAQARRSFLNAQARRSSLECQLVIANRRTGVEPVVGRFGLSR